MGKALFLRIYSWYNSNSVHADRNAKLLEEVLGSVGTIKSPHMKVNIKMFFAWLEA